MENQLEVIAIGQTRYHWWGYVKSEIRRYPDLCLKAAAIKAVSTTANYSGMNVKGNSVSRTTENIALRQLSPMDQKALDAVNAAIEDTKRDVINGQSKLELINLVFWAKTYTLMGAADNKIHVSYSTAKRWHNKFIKSVAKHMGYDIK